MLAEALRSTLTGLARIMMHRQGQEQMTMTAAQPVSPVTEGIRSLEVRWIFPGRWNPRWPDGSHVFRPNWRLARTPTSFSGFARAFGEAPGRRGP